MFRKKRISVTGTVERMGESFVSSLLAGKAYTIHLAVRMEPDQAPLIIAQTAMWFAQLPLVQVGDRVDIVYSKNRKGELKLHGFGIRWKKVVAEPESPEPHPHETVE